MTGRQIRSICRGHFGPFTAVPNIVIVSVQENSASGESNFTSGQIESAIAIEIFKHLPQNVRGQKATTFELFNAQTPERVA
jgi:hypothetical protein